MDKCLRQIRITFCGLPASNLTLQKDHINMNPGKSRGNIRIGASVGIVLKQDQKSGTITQGVVKKILTNSTSHPHGIKVQLEDGRVGRVKEIN